MTTRFTRRRLLGSTLAATGALLTGLGIARGHTLSTKGKMMLDSYSPLSRGVVEAATFPMIEAIHGRRSRRFAKGASIPKLDPTEQTLLISTVAGNTGWVNLFAHHPGYAGKLPNYTTAVGGRRFPSSAGFNTTGFFLADDTGGYFLPTRDMTPVPNDGTVDLKAWTDAHRARIVKLADGRLNIPAAMPYMEGHNAWCVNVPGSTLIRPVADVAQHVILLLLYLVQNGTGIYDGVNSCQIPRLEKFAHRLNLDVAYQMTFLEQVAMTDVATETGTACYAGALMLQALGLGGWMYTGINPFVVLGASGDPAVPGLGFQFRMLEGHPLPYITGLPGVFEAHVPPHHADMRAALEAVVARKFGAGGPFDAGQGGQYRENAAVRGAGATIDAEAVEATAIMAKYVFATFGRFPATAPAVFINTDLQAHRFDTGFYDTHFAPGAFLRLTPTTTATGADPLGAPGVSRASNDIPNVNRPAPPTGGGHGVSCSGHLSWPTQPFPAVPMACRSGIVIRPLIKTIRRRLCVLGLRPRIIGRALWGPARRC